jgi:hypothetical protein
VLNQPIGTPKPSAVLGNGSGTKKMSAGIIALIAVMGFFVLCFVMFAVRWWIHWRRYRVGAGIGEKGGGGCSGAVYVLSSIPDGTRGLIPV